MIDGVLYITIVEVGAVVAYILGGETSTWVAIMCGICLLTEFMLEVIRVEGDDDFIEGEVHSRDGIIINTIIGVRVILVIQLICFIT